MYIHKKLIKKRQLIRAVSGRVRGRILRCQVDDVINLFFDEFIDELTVKKQINIGGFCSFNLEKNRPRKYFDVNRRCFSISKPRNLLKIKLDSELHKRITQNIDILKTFMGE